MVDTDGHVMVTREIGNVRFLIEHQLRLIDDLERRRLDGRSAHELLRRLMRREEDLRERTTSLMARRVA